MHISTLASALLVLVVAGGCAVTSPVEAPALTNADRNQIGHLAVRGPSRPSVMLASNLDTKGAAAGKTAASAGLGWLNGTFEAAGQSNDEGAILVAAFGLITTPLVAAGGAVYGAAAADTRDAINEGNSVLEQALDFAPAQLQHALVTEFGASAPVTYEFVPVDVSDQELTARGFDSVLDIEMDSIASRPSDNDFQVYFETVNRTRLRSLASGKVLAIRTHRRDLPARAVSSWAKQEGDELATALNQSFAGIAEDVVNELFLAPAIRVKGMEPVSRSRFQISRIPGTRPMFVWSALDGGLAAPQGDVEYEIVIAAKGQQEGQAFRTRTMRYTPTANLEGCRMYSWQVRAHYSSFGVPQTSAWTPEYRFKTECDN
jgi:hypothetical protein